MPAAPTRYVFDAIGTRWSIDTPKPLSARLRQMIHDVCTEFDATFSRFKPDSAISELARHGGSHTFVPGAEALFEFYESLYSLTDGRVTPMIGGTLSDLGYDADYSFSPKPIQPIESYQDVVTRSGSTLRLKHPALLDFGAAGKGFLVDQVADILQDEYAFFTVDASGDVYVFGRPETIGLEDPADPTRVLGTMAVENAAVCASATNRRTWGDGLHHIIDPTTQKPTQGVRATWVRAESTMVADGLATALFFIQPARLMADYDFSYVVMHDDGSVTYSPDKSITLYD